MTETTTTVLQLVLQLADSNLIAQLAIVIVGAALAKFQNSKLKYELSAKRKEDFKSDLALMAEEAVSQVYNEYVRDAKLNAAFDSAAKKEARAMARTKILGLAAESGIDMMSNVSKRLLDRYIENAVKKMKE